MITPASDFWAKVGVGVLFGGSLLAILSYGIGLDIAVGMIILGVVCILMVLIKTKAVR